MPSHGRHSNLDDQLRHDMDHLRLQNELLRQEFELTMPEPAELTLESDLIILKDSWNHAELLLNGITLRVEDSTEDRFNFDKSFYLEIKDVNGRLERLFAAIDNINVVGDVPEAIECIQLREFLLSMTGILRGFTKAFEEVSEVAMERFQMLKDSKTWDDGDFEDDEELGNEWLNGLQDHIEDYTDQMTVWDRTAANERAREILENLQDNLSEPENEYEDLLQLFLEIYEGLSNYWCSFEVIYTIKDVRISTVGPDFYD